MSDIDQYLTELLGSVSTGLPDDFTGTITNMRFVADAGYKDGQFLVGLCDIETTDPDLGTLEDQRFSLGGTGDTSKYRWLSEDKGASIVRDDGKKASFNNNTGMGKLLASLLDQDVFKSAVTKRAQAGERHSPMTAAFYNGITGHWSRVEDPPFTGNNGEQVVISHLVVDEFESFGKKATPAPAAVKAAPAKRAPKKAAPKKAEVVEEVVEVPAEVVEEVGADGGDDAMSLAIWSIAREVVGPNGDSDPDTFSMRCYEEIDGIDDSPEHMAKIDDCDEGSIWSDAWYEANP